MNLGGSEILLILLVVLLLFGGKRLPELARSIGKGLAEFRRATQEIQREIQTPLLDSSLHPKSPPASVKPEPEPVKPTVHANPSAQPRSSETTSGSDS
jgi:sec-independent protein translocase protein TatA